MPTPIIPKTKVRLVPYIEVRFNKHEPFYYNEDTPTVSFDGDNNILGYVEKVEIDSEREAHILRALDYKLSGRVAEAYPGLPKYTIKLDRIVLYSDDVLEKLTGKYNHEGIIAQDKPLAFEFSLYEPPESSSSSGSTGESFKLNRTITAYGCWLTKHPFPIDITRDDLKIVQNIEITATLIKYSKPTSST